eukprot:TRINITY_DN56110_c0_g1_i1.p1 TRINITY_DN56110_c0_g1~~TRINITY_DN56110_c0_g1_i1.p1  ORF type:complete len:444 (+),score=102.95 TRINITY_DN56110_c0_g1_i1:78-1334(+)
MASSEGGDTSRGLHKSHAEFNRAKRLHLTDVANVNLAPPPGSPVHLRRHPCQRPAHGPEHRTWKFRAGDFVDPREEVSPGGNYRSRRSMAQVKHLHCVGIGGREAPDDTPRDPQTFRHRSHQDLAHEVRNNKTPLFPVRAAHSQEPPAAPPAPPQPSEQPPAAAASGSGEGAARRSQRALAEGKRHHIRLGNDAPSPGRPQHPAAAAGSPTNAYYQRVERARTLRAAAEASAAVSPDRSAAPSNAAPSYRRVRGPGGPAGGCVRPAGVSLPRDSACITLAQGSNYPRSPDPVHPASRDAASFQHTSQARLRDEKAVSATPLHPLPRDPPPPPPASQPMASQQAFAHHKSRHARTHASPQPSPQRSPQPSGRSPSQSPAGSPPRYVGLRWSAGGRPAAGGSPNLWAQRCVREPSPQCSR